MPSRVYRALPETPASFATRHAARRSVLAAAIVLTSALACVLVLAGCAEEPPTPVPFRLVPADRVLLPGYTQPGDGLVAVDVRRERSKNVIVKLRDAPVYVDGQRVTDLMNGEHVVFYLSPGVHRIGVTTQFDPVMELRFMVDPRYTNRASVAFDDDHHIQIRRVAQ